MSSLEAIKQLRSEYQQKSVYRKKNQKWKTQRFLGEQNTGFYPLRLKFIGKHIHNNFSSATSIEDFLFFF